MGGIPYGDDNVCMHVHEVTHDLVVRTAADSFTGQSSLSLKPGSVCRGVCVCVYVCVACCNTPIEKGHQEPGLSLYAGRFKESSANRDLS